MVYAHHRDHLIDLITKIADFISDPDNCALFDLPLRVLINLLEQIDNEAIIKEFHSFVPVILQSVLTAFTNEEITTHGRE